MLLLAAVLSIAAAPIEIAGPYMSISSNMGPHSISLLDNVSRSDSIVTELNQVLSQGGAAEHSHCTEHQGYNMCSIALQGPGDVKSVTHNFPSLGAWEVIFKGPAAVELNDILQGLETSVGMPGSYVISASKRIICEIGVETCIIRSFDYPAYSEVQQ